MNVCNNFYQQFKIKACYTCKVGSTIVSLFCFQFDLKLVMSLNLSETLALTIAGVHVIEAAQLCS